SSQCKAGIKTRHECAGQTFVAGMTDNMIDAIGPGYFNRAIGAPVINNKPFNGIEPIYLSR
ncbi:MAG: hypothetical protein OQK66_09695, partial [Prosthecochloris sp.]